MRPWVWVTSHAALQRHSTMAWLSQRLATLGVETAADLALLNTADLVPDLEAETGVPGWVSEPILAGLPRLWRFQGGTYSCTVSCGSRTVLLEPVSMSHNVMGRLS